MARCADLETFDFKSMKVFCIQLSITCEKHFKIPLLCYAGIRFDCNSDLQRPNQSYGASQGYDSRFKHNKVSFFDPLTVPAGGFLNLGYSAFCLPKKILMSKLNSFGFSMSIPLNCLLVCFGVSLMLVGLQVG